MSNSLEAFSVALKEARQIESHGGFIVEQAGGSAHGTTEILYRIHASRLKCLIAAVSAPEEELEEAELEALRITEKHWFKALWKNQKIKDIHIRDRVWYVLSDIVTALVQCRLNQTFFHRSVYRHAQALMWATVLDDPIAGRVEGSLGAVAATKSFQIRGLNNSTNVASSAAVVMGNLFDKKR